MYTSDAILGNRSFYSALNTVLREKERKRATPFVRFIWLVLWAMRHSAQAANGSVVYRGIPEDLGGRYEVGATVVWHQFASCTDSEAVLWQNAQFFNRSRASTVFVIELTASRATPIWQLSLHPGEREVLLPLNSQPGLLLYCYTSCILTSLSPCSLCFLHTHSTINYKHHHATHL